MSALPVSRVVVPDATDSGTARAGRLTLIVLLHAAFFLTLQSGLAQSPASAPAPKTVFVSFLTAEAPPPPVPAPPKRTPPKPKVKPTPAPKPKPRPKPLPKAIEPVPQLEQSVPEPANPEPPQAASEPVAPPAPAQPAPPASAPSPPVVRPTPRTVSSGIAYLQQPAPDYPKLARRMGEEGTTVLRVLVDARGRPERAEVETSSGSPRLDDAARRAVLRALFKPHVEDGRAVAVFALIPIRFQLDS